MINDICDKLHTNAVVLSQSGNSPPRPRLSATSSGRAAKTSLRMVQRWLSTPTGHLLGVAMRVTLRMLTLAPWAWMSALGLSLWPWTAVVTLLIPTGTSFGSMVVRIGLSAHFGQLGRSNVRLGSIDLQSKPNITVALCGFLLYSSPLKILWGIWSRLDLQLEV